MRETKETARLTEGLRNRLFAPKPAHSMVATGRPKYDRPSDRQVLHARRHVQLHRDSNFDPHHDATWNLTQITSQHGRWIKLTYDTLNRITRAEDNISRVVLYTYDTIGRLETVTNAANVVTRFTYDAQHRIRTIPTRATSRI